MYEVKTSPWEMESWDEDKLENFTIDSDRVDRQYLVHSQENRGTDSDWTKPIYLLLRVIHDNRHLFVEIRANVFKGLEWLSDGSIYLTADPNLFYRAVGPGLKPPNVGRLYHLLRDDGYEVDETVMRRKPRTLVNLCQDTIWMNRQKLQEHYPKVLPSILKKSVDTFFHTEKALENYKNGPAEVSDFKSLVICQHNE